MRPSAPVFPLLAALGVSGALIPAELAAQSLWLIPRTEKVVALEVLKPEFDGADNATFLTTVWYASARVPVTDRVRFVAELPFAHLGVSSQVGRGLGDDAFGNPYVGIELRSPGSRVFGELGLRLPLAPDNNSATFVGIFTDIDRWEAFTTEYVPVSGTVNYRYRDTTGLVATLRTGASFWISTGGGDSEVLLAYSAQLGYEGRDVGLTGGLSGRAVLSADDASLGERTLHQFGVAASFGSGRVRPGVHLRFPLDDDMSDILDFVFGLSVAVALP